MHSGIFSLLVVVASLPMFLSVADAHVSLDSSGTAQAQAQAQSSAYSQVGLQQYPYYPPDSYPYNPYNPYIANPPQQNFVSVIYCIKNFAFTVLGLGGSNYGYSDYSMYPYAAASAAAR